jgi:glycosyltransferase involved in cell wall biosynthesis
VPGPEQYTFAKKLGFKQENILTGVYSCDFNLFDAHYKRNKANKSANLPKRFLFIGRYYDFKGCNDLWNAFIQLKKEDKSFDWELWCLGTGSLIPAIHPDIKHFGFVQPENLGQYIAETSVFVMPSHIEPWGVVLHEMAAAGMPILASNKVGAAVAFLQEGKNGFLFNSGDEKQIKKLLQKMAQTPTLKINQMGDASNKIAAELSPIIWAKKIKKLL